MANTSASRSAIEPQVSVKGLDDFSRKFLTGATRPEKEGEEFLHVPDITKQAGSTAPNAALDAYHKQRKVDFIRSAGMFTEDLIAFIVEQRRARNLSDEETVFSVALASINLRNAYGSPQGAEKKLTTEQCAALLERFDEICWGAQQYYNANV